MCYLAYILTEKLGNKDALEKIFILSNNVKRGPIDYVSSHQADLGFHTKGGLIITLGGQRSSVPHPPTDDYWFMVAGTLVINHSTHPEQVYC